MKEVCPKTFDSFDCEYLVCVCVPACEIGTHMNPRSSIQTLHNFAYVQCTQANILHSHIHLHPCMGDSMVISFDCAFYQMTFTFFTLMNATIYTLDCCVYKLYMIIWFWFGSWHGFGPKCARREECMIQILRSKFMSSGGRFIIFYNDDVGMMLLMWWVFSFYARYATEIYFDFGNCNCTNKIWWFICSIRFIILAILD